MSLILLISGHASFAELIALFKKDNIAHDAHLVGGICGLVFGFICTNESMMSIINTYIDKINIF